MRLLTAVAFVLIAGPMWWVQGQSTDGGTAAWEFATVESLQEVWVGNIKTSTPTSAITFQTDAAGTQFGSRSTDGAR
jgi:hypothetical protein